MRQMNEHTLRTACELVLVLKKKHTFQADFFFRYVLASALRDMNQSKEITAAPKDCDNSGSIWETGKDLFNFIRKQVLLNGETGKVAFDDQGDRINAEYNIVNVQRKKKKVLVGKHYYSKVGYSTTVCYYH